MLVLRLLPKLLLLMIIGVAASVTSMTYCQIVNDRTFQPNSNESFLSRYQFLSSPFPTVIDCAYLCLSWSRCRTAVFEENTKTCAMFNLNAASNGMLVTNSTGIFTTIITDRSSSSLMLIPPVVNVSAVWNTTAGQNSLPATPGNDIGKYYPLEHPKNLFDGNWTSHLASYGLGNQTAYSNISGVNTGVYLTIPDGPFILEAFRVVTTKNSNSRDPTKLTIEGSNAAASFLMFGSSWTLIYNGTTGLDNDPGRNRPGVQQFLSDNTLAFSSYRFLITERRAPETCVDYGEIELFQT